METQRLSASHVKVGEPLPGDIYDETAHMLLSAGFVITDQAMLEALLSRGMYVDIKTFNTHYSGATEPVAVIEKKFDPFHIRDSLKKKLNRTLRSLHQIKDAETQIADLAATIRQLTGTDAEGAVASGILDQDESYAIRHNLQSGILCDLVATALEWPNDKRQSAVCAALTMNAGILDLQNKLVHQKTPLTPQQEQLVIEHPEGTHDMLREAGVSDPAWLAAVKEHHERGDGKGYPSHLTQPGEIGRMLHIVDTFGALIAPRGDRPMQTPPQAIRTIFAEEGQGPNGAFAGALVKVLGVFPPGTFVKLANNEMAVIYRRGAAADTPLVGSLTSQTGNPYMKPVPRDTRNKDFAIKGLVARDKVSTGYDLATLWVTRAKS